MSLLHVAGGAAEDKLYPEDVFSVYLRVGTGADVTVNTNVDMTKGYMLWIKGRSGATDHAIYDSARGVTKDLATNSTAAETTQTTGLKAISTAGYTIGSLAKMNTSGATYVDFVFRKAPKFFDIVTWTGANPGGTTGVIRNITHSLGVTPGMIIVKRVDSAGNWSVWHNGLSANQRIKLDQTDPQNGGSDYFGDGFGTTVAPTSTVFTVGTNNNTVGATYVAYLFAHDPSADGIIQCGSFTTDGSGKVTKQTLGFEPQYLLTKNTTSAWSWKIHDAMRGFPIGYAGKGLSPNLSDAEASSDTVVDLLADGFSSGGNFGASQTYIYLAIRRPMKVPTSGAQVFSQEAITPSTGGTFTTNFPIDSTIYSYRTNQGYRGVFQDRLRGWAYTSSAAGNYPILTSTTTNAESTYNNFSPFMWGFDRSNSVGYGSNTGSISSAVYALRRAPGFFDIVCRTGVLPTVPINHNLGVVPELIIEKTRNTGGDWYVWTSDKSGRLNVTNAMSSSSQMMTSTTYTPLVTGGGQTYVAYLFATCPGVSKVGSYIGNGTSQTINCGFSTGARFILIKCTNSTGDWYTWDTARGIVAANDPHLSLNTTAAEVTTDDSVDPESTGFIVNQNTATNINVNGASYIFLSIS